MSRVCWQCKEADATVGGWCAPCWGEECVISRGAAALKGQFEKEFTYLYFVNINYETIKVGITYRPLHRMKDYNRKFKGVELMGYMVGSRTKEIEITNMFYRFRAKELRHCEWFHYRQEILDYTSENLLPLDAVRRQISEAWEQYKAQLSGNCREAVYKDLIMRTPDTLSHEIY